MEESACLWDTPKQCKECKYRKVLLSQVVAPDVVVTQNICLREVDKCTSGLQKNFMWETEIVL